MATIIIITHDLHKGTTTRRQVEAEVALTHHDLHSSTGTATIDGKQLSVTKDHIEGPYCNWKHTQYLE